MFADNGAAHLPGFLDADLLEVIQEALDTAPFSAVRTDSYAEERLPRSHPLAHHLCFLLNDPALFRAVEELSGAGPIGCFSGRAYRRGSDGHFDSWHADCVDTRLIGLSINLGREPFEGGALRLREVDSGALLFDYANRTPGDAVLFRVASHLEHCVNPVRGPVARTAFAGWFRAAPDFRASSLVPRPSGTLRSAAPGHLPPCLRLPKAVAAHEVDGALVVHHARNDAYASLDAAGARLLELFDYARGRAPSEVTALLHDEYDAEPAVLAREVEELAGCLHHEGLLEAA